MEIININRGTTSNNGSKINIFTNHATHKSEINLGRGNLESWKQYYTNKKNA